MIVQADSDTPACEPADRRPGPGRRALPGQATLELAIGITVLLLLVVGLIEVTPPIVRAAQLSQAVRAGVAYGRIAPIDTFGIRKRVVQAAPGIYGSLTDAEISAMTNSQIAVTCTAGLDGAGISCASAGRGDSVTVTANYAYAGVLTSLFSTVLDAPLEISRAATSEIY